MTENTNIDSAVKALLSPFHSSLDATSARLDEIQQQLDEFGARIRAAIAQDSQCMVCKGDLYPGQAGRICPFCEDALYEYEGKAR